MYQKIYHICTQSAKGKNLLILLFAYLLMTVFVLQWSVATLMTNTTFSQLIDWHFSYSVEQVYALLKSYGSEGREWYTLIELTIDFVISLTYGFLLSFSIIYFYKKLSVKEAIIKTLFLFPFAALTADFLENTSIILLLINYPYKLVLVAKAANIFTYTKWILMLTSVTLILVGALLASFRFIRFKFAAKSISR